MSCRSCGNDQSNGQMEQVTPPTADLGVLPSSEFCWKCFIFWALVIAVIWVLLTDDGGE